MDTLHKNYGPLLELAIQPMSEQCIANAAAQDAGATEKFSLLFHDPLLASCINTFFTL